jgi:hypothetical protein
MRDYEDMKQTPEDDVSIKEFLRKNAARDMYEEKKWYVERLLEPVLQASYLDVDSLSYEKNGSLEVVTIIYIGGHRDRINVTWNSLGAILKEVALQATGHDAVGYMPPKR